LSKFSKESNFSEQFIGSKLTENYYFLNAKTNIKAAAVYAGS
jgi:hypothetical protein